MPLEAYSLGVTCLYGPDSHKPLACASLLSQKQVQEAWSISLWTLFRRVRRQDQVHRIIASGLVMVTQILIWRIRTKMQSLPALPTPASCYKAGDMSGSLIQFRQTCPRANCALSWSDHGSYGLGHSYRCPICQLSDWNLPLYRKLWVLYNSCLSATFLHQVSKSVIMVNSWPSFIESFLLRLLSELLDTCL